MHGGHEEGIEDLVGNPERDYYENLHVGKRIILRGA
jgi:hypothetical protein